MTENLLAAAGRALYGEGFVPSLAAALEVNERTVQRWAAGTMYPPRGIWRQLQELLAQRGDELAAVRAAIAALVRDDPG